MGVWSGSGDLQARVEKAPDVSHTTEDNQARQASTLSTGACCHLHGGLLMGVPFFAFRPLYSESNAFSKLHRILVAASTASRTSRNVISAPFLCAISCLLTTAELYSDTSLSSKAF